MPYESWRSSQLVHSRTKKEDAPCETGVRGHVSVRQEGHHAVKVSQPAKRTPWRLFAHQDSRTTCLSANKPASSSYTPPICEPWPCKHPHFHSRASVTLKATQLARGGADLGWCEVDRKHEVFIIL
jgi:hypothetical protein